MARDEDKGEGMGQSSQGRRSRWLDRTAVARVAAAGMLGCLLSSSAGAQAPEAPPAEAPSAAPEEAPAATPAGAPVVPPDEAKREPAKREPLASEPPNVVVTATRLPRPIRDVPQAMVVVTRRELDASPALTMDSLVRSVPSVATFRRSSSLAADPSSQGLNLRGLGPSGSSRALVLLDGVPVNDPFGGWVYWRSLPPLGVERIEVAPQGGSALYGNYALGGVLQLVSRPIVGTSAEAELGVGTAWTRHVAARATHRVGRFGAAVEGEYLASQGYPVVAPWHRGAIDGATPSAHGTIQARVESQLAESLSLSAQGGFFDEQQNGGTQFTAARVRGGDYRAAGRMEAASGRFELAFFGHVQRFGQDRARIAADRSSEELSARQSVPGEDQGAWLLWSRAFLEGAHQVSAGLDARRVAGRADESLFPAVVRPTSVLFRSSGGEQRFLGLFAQDQLAVGKRLQLLAAARVDVWSSIRGAGAVERQDGTFESTLHPSTNGVQLSPRVGGLWRPLEVLGLRASGYQAFRAPTLNELYRPFQVGTVLTAANPALQAESVLGAEAGLELTPPVPLVARATGFWNNLSRPIVNATLAEPLPDGATRQRQNLGWARVRGLELGLDWRVGRRWTALGAYTWVDSRVMDAPDAEVVGKQLPQDPNHRASVGLLFDDPRFVTASAQLRWVGPQFEDDRNELGMAGFVVLDLSLSRRLFWNIELFGGVENLLDRRYLVGRAGVDTIGQPFTARLGLRLRERS